MAITLADAVVLLGADDSGLKNDLGKAETKTKGWTSNIGSLAKGALTGVVVGAGLAAAAAVAKIGVEAFNVSRDTETAAADIAASLGLPMDAAEEFAEVARRVFGNNFAGSVTEAGEAVAILAQQLGLAADDPALQTLTENAFALQDVFGTDITKSVDAAKTLMDNFGLSGEEAFDLITAGQQKGLDRSGDFLETITEYSVQFANGGATASEFFSLLESGLQGGVLGTDKAADAFKEFRVRIQDGSKTTMEALTAIGIDADEMSAKLADGSMTAAEAFQTVIGRLGEVDDANVRMQAGVGLLGTQFEDLGETAALQLSLVRDSFEDVEDASESLSRKYETFGQLWGAVWRRTIVAVSPLTDRLLDLSNRAMPLIERGFGFIEQLLDGKLLPRLAETNSTFGALGKWFEENMPLIRQTVETVLGWIGAFWSEHGETIMHVVTNVWTIVKTTIETTLLTILDIIKVIMQLINGDFEGAGETLKGIVRRLWDAIVLIFRTQIDNVKTIFTEVDWSALGSAILNGIANGMRSGANSIKDAARDAAKSALDSAKSFLGIDSPSKEAAQEIGRPFAEGVGVGIQEEMDRVARNVSAGLNVMLGGAGGAATAGGPISVTLYQNFGGDVDRGVVRNGSRDGVLAGLRQAGLR